MTQRIVVLALITGAFLTAAASAQAPSPRKQLKLLVEQLQSAPEDDDLRRKIIKLARDVKPLPAVPDAAIEAEGRGKFLFKTAESAQDYLPAAKEYERATDAAPWVLGYYSDLCMVDEKAKKYVEAKRACELYLLGLTDQDMIADTKSRIAGLKLGAKEAQRKENPLWNWRGKWTFTIPKAMGGGFLTVIELEVGDISGELKTIHDHGDPGARRSIDKEHYRIAFSDGYNFEEITRTGESTAHFRLWAGDDTYGEGDLVRTTSAQGKTTGNPSPFVE